MTGQGRPNSSRNAVDSRAERVEVFTKMCAHLLSGTRPDGTITTVLSQGAHLQWPGSDPVHISDVAKIATQVAQVEVSGTTYPSWNETSQNRLVGIRAGTGWNYTLGVNPTRQIHLRGAGSLTYLGQIFAAAGLCCGYAPEYLPTQDLRIAHYLGTYGIGSKITWEYGNVVE